MTATASDRAAAQEAWRDGQARYHEMESQEP
jgi:hypothetical protein